MDPRPPVSPTSPISATRKLLFYAGYLAYGAAVALAVWVACALFEPASYTPSGLRHVLIGGAIAVALWFVGLFLRRLGVLGLAGSGLLLNPMRARRELEPWSRAAGGLLSSALNEVHVPREVMREVVKVRCPSCAALNDETSRRCRACGGLMA